MAFVSIAARKAAYEHAVKRGTIPPDIYEDAFMSGQWDESTDVKSFSVFEEKIKGEGRCVSCLHS